MTQATKNLNRSLTSLTVAALCLAGSTVSMAQGTGESKLKISGFVSLVGGQVFKDQVDADYALDGGLDPIAGVACPCYVADWSNAGIYGKTFSLEPESRAGVQASYALTDKLNLVAQVTVRGTNGSPDLTWAYGSYKLAPNWEVQLGRKRIPLYYYSDFQDIGVAYPWVSPPPELYGWDATNYNGASVRYSRSYGDTNVAASVFAGREDIDKSLYQKIYGSDNTKITWKNILGGDLEVNNGPITVRGVYLKADVETDGDPAELSAYGIAANLDYDSWFALSEYTSLTRKFTASGFSYSAPAFTIGAGMRLGKWTPFVNYAVYEENNTAGDVSVWKNTIWKRTSASVRYDLNSSSSVKTQLDRVLDTGNSVGGNATVLRISYDRVF